MASISDLMADASDKLNLAILQSKMKSDPEGYISELALIYKQFKSSMELFQQQAALSFTSLSGIAADSTVAKDLSERAMFLAHVTPFYPTELAKFPTELLQFLESSARNLPSGLRVHLTHALILLVNSQTIRIVETLAIFMELQTVGDRELKELASTRVIQTIKRMNQKHKNDPNNRTLQNILFRMLQQEEEAKAKRALIILCDLHRRKVWFDDRTANAICMSCFHPSTRIMIAGLSFLLGIEKIEDDDSDDSGSEDDEATPQPHVVVNKEALYKANHVGTASSKKKKKAKLQRVIRSMKKQQRLSSEKSSPNHYSPLIHLKDAQGFAEKLFSRLQSCNEKFEVKMMMLKVIARTIGLHKLILLKFYPHIQKYVQPHQRDVTNLLAAAVQACHEMVPPDAVEPLLKQIVNQFVHDRSPPEAITVGLNVVREICLSMPLLMTEDLLQDLVLYKKSHEKSVSSAARSLLTLFREVCPSLLIKKDRGRPSSTNPRPKAFGEVHVDSNIPGVELLEDDCVDLLQVDGSRESDGDSECESTTADSDSEMDDEIVEDDELFDENDIDLCDENGDENEEFSNKLESKKRKLVDFEEQLSAGNQSLSALKKLAGATKNDSLDTADGILSNEDFQRIKELKAKKEARSTLSKHGFKVPSSDQLRMKRIDAATLEGNIRRKLAKEERLAFIREVREERGKYQSSTAVKQKKTGGLSNRQKERRKAMPLPAKRSKIARSRINKKKKASVAGKQFRGRKAWK